MAIYFFNEEIDFLFKNKLRCKNWIKSVAVKEKRKIGNINIIFCSDEFLIRLNRDYLYHDYYTDVITFDNCVRNVLNGEIYISIDTVRKNSETYMSLFDFELNRVIIHGILHLIGYKDDTLKSKEIIRNLEDLYLEMLCSSFI